MTTALRAEKLRREEEQRQREAVETFTSAMTGEKRCVWCGQVGHHSNHCKLPRPQPRRAGVLR
jgi:hypothetical protein